MGILDSVFGKKNEEKIKEPVKVQPVDDSISLFNSGVQFYDSGNYERAEDELRKLLRLNPGHKQAHYYLGRICESRMQGDDDFETMEEAMNKYQEAIKVDPNYIDAHIRLGGLYVKSGFYEGAMRELEEALRINPSSAEAHAAMGDACYTIGIGKEIKVEHPAGVGATSDFRGAKEYYKKAVEEFNEAIKLSPHLADKLQPLIQRARQKSK
ncbi:MAG: tetratricopeptide repeat protein [Ignavibacteriales bacterium]